MPLHDLMSTAEIKALFTEEVTAAGGTVSDTFDDGVCLFTRSILPQVREVRTGDGLQGGVALRATEEDVRVHPYVFRLVCRNGAIIAHAMQTLHVECGEFATPEEAAEALRAAIQECAAEEAFATAVSEIQFARQTEADMALTMMPMLSRLPSGLGGAVHTDHRSEVFPGGRPHALWSHERGHVGGARYLRPGSPLAPGGAWWRNPRLSQTPPQTRPYRSEKGAGRVLDDTVAASGLACQLEPSSQPGRLRLRAAPLHPAPYGALLTCSTRG